MRERCFRKSSTVQRLRGGPARPSLDGFAESLLAQGYAPTKHTAHFEVKHEGKDVSAFQLELLTDPNLPRGGPGRSIEGTGALTEFEVQYAPADAEFYYKMAVPGDPVTIAGSPKGGTWDNGWTEWFLNWHSFLKGSALRQAVVAGPDGSKFVDPSTLTASSASAPLETAKPGNSRGG